MDRTLTAARRRGTRRLGLIMVVQGLLAVGAGIVLGSVVIPVVMVVLVLGSELAGVAIYRRWMDPTKSSGSHAIDSSQVDHGED
jgi:hypothetical protein